MILKSNFLFEKKEAIQRQSSVLQNFFCRKYTFIFFTSEEKKQNAQFHPLFFLGGGGVVSTKDLEMTQSREVNEQARTEDRIKTKPT